MVDASRKILSYREFERATTEHSIQMLEMAIAHASEYRIVIREVNTDRGTQFYSNRGGKSQFQRYLEEREIKHVVSRWKKQSADEWQSRKVLVRIRQA